MEKIKVEKRNLTGKKIKQLRDKGIIPAVVYNSKGESVNVSIDKGTAVQLYKTATSTTVLDIEVDGKTKKAIVKDVDINPRTEDVLHISFFEINPKAEMVFTLPFKLTGVSPAVKNNIGILVQVSDSLKVRCKLENLIPEIEIDVNGLEHPGQTISMKDIELPKGLELVHEEEKDIPIATITQLQKVEVIEEEPEIEEGEEGEEEIEGEETEEQEGSESEETPGENPSEEKVSEE